MGVSPPPAIQAGFNTTFCLGSIARYKGLKGGRGRFQYNHSV